MVSVSSDCPGDAGVWAGGAGRAQSRFFERSLGVFYVIISPPSAASL